MNVLYTKYQSSDNLKLLRMIAVIIVTVVLMVIGIRKEFIVPNVIALPVWLIGAMLVIVVGLLEIYKQLDIAKLYPIIAITLGLFFIFLIPAYETPDEQDHFGSAYNISNTWLGLERPNDFSFYMRQTDAVIERVDLDNPADEACYHKVIDNLRFVNEWEETEILVINKITNAGFVTYMLPAIGITVARLLHLGFGWEYVLGALLNMILYIALTTYALHVMPIGKRILFVVSLLPITLQQVSSFSYDCALMACTMVVVAISFKWRQWLRDRGTGPLSQNENDIEKSATRNPSPCRVKKLSPYLVRHIVIDSVLLIFSAIVFASIKSGVFLVVLLLPLALCIRKSWFTGRYKLWTIGATVLIVVAIAVYMFFFGGIFRIALFLTTVPSDIREISGQSGIAPIEYITHPKKFFDIVFNSIRENLFHRIAQIGGTALGYLRIFIHRVIFGGNLLILLVSMIRYNKETDEYKVGNRILSFIIGIIPIVITLLAMLLFWTLPTDEYIKGFQGRYILPTLAILMLSVGRWKKITIPNIDNLFAMGMTITGYATCLDIL